MPGTRWASIFACIDALSNKTAVDRVAKQVPSFTDEIGPLPERRAMQQQRAGDLNTLKACGTVVPIRRIA